MLIETRLFILTEARSDGFEVLCRYNGIDRSIRSTFVGSCESKQAKLGKPSSMERSKQICGHLLALYESLQAIF